MNYFDRHQVPLTAVEARANLLNAARVLRDLSFLHLESHPVRIGCRDVMRTHSLHWRVQRSVQR